MFDLFDTITTAHDREHYRCEQLGLGACVPVVCSCGERWAGDHEYHDRFLTREGECAECDAHRMVGECMRCGEPLFGDNEFEERGHGLRFCSRLCAAPGSLD